MATTRRRMPRRGGGTVRRRGGGKGIKLRGCYFNEFVNGKPYFKEPWEVLGVDEKATENEVKAAYRKKVLEKHPDRGGSEDAFAQLNAANEVMSDPIKRREYIQRRKDYGPKSRNPSKTGLHELNDAEWTNPRMFTKGESATELGLCMFPRNAKLLTMHLVRLWLRDYVKCITVINEKKSNLPYLLTIEGTTIYFKRLPLKLISKFTRLVRRRIMYRRIFMAIAGAITLGLGPLPIAGALLSTPAWGALLAGGLAYALVNHDIPVHQSENKPVNHDILESVEHQNDSKSNAIDDSQSSLLLSRLNNFSLAKTVAETVANLNPVPKNYALFINEHKERHNSAARNDKTSKKICAFIEEEVNRDVQINYGKRSRSGSRSSRNRSGSRSSNNRESHYLEAQLKSKNNLKDKPPPLVEALKVFLYNEGSIEIQGYFLKQDEINKDKFWFCVKHNGKIYVLGEYNYSFTTNKKT